MNVWQMLPAPNMMTRHGYSTQHIDTLLGIFNYYSSALGSYTLVAGTPTSIDVWIVAMRYSFYDFLILYLLLFKFF